MSSCGRLLGGMWGVAESFVFLLFSFLVVVFLCLSFAIFLGGGIALFLFVKLGIFCCFVQYVCVDVCFFDFFFCAGCLLLVLRAFGVPLFQKYWFWSNNGKGRLIRVFFVQV